MCTSPAAWSLGCDGSSSRLSYSYPEKDHKTTRPQRPKPLLVGPPFLFLFLFLCLPGHPGGTRATCNLQLERARHSKASKGKSESESESESTAAFDEKLGIEVLCDITLPRVFLSAPRPMFLFSTRPLALSPNDSTYSTYFSTCISPLPICPFALFLRSCEDRSRNLSCRNGNTWKAEEPILP